MRIILALVAGSLFGAGLHISGMTDTTKVQGFLDFFGAWDVTLAFVMGGAIIPMAIAWRMVPGRAPLVGGSFAPAPDPAVDRRLITGSILFGVGWGLIGLCPGPAIASLTYGGWTGALFMISMLGGMIMAPAAARRLDSMGGQA
jgi:uncharacterized membrane protein YedE/YeeE|tara:strand:+ start:2339 stop:2770 length:432 start_codon:yes stop_codon:yes gene_type:complete